MQKIKAYLKLIRFHNYFGTLFAFFPCLFSCINNNKLTPENFVMFFFLAMFGRSFGCVINDIMDHDIDSKTLRTSNRPIASNELSRKEAFKFFVFLCVVGIWILSLFSSFVFVASIICAAFTMIYPLFKRFTYFPQVFLGLAFNFGALIAPLIVKNSISFEDVVLYFACVLWTISYDTFYAFADLEDDIKNKVKSMAIKLRNKKHALYFINFISLLLFLYSKTSASNYFTAFVAITLVLFVSWQIKYLDHEKPDSAMIKFKSSIVVGMLVCLLLV